jgi:hypothetical protein
MKINQHYIASLCADIGHLRNWISDSPVRQDGECRQWLVEAADDLKRIIQVMPVDKAEKEE